MSPENQYNNIYVKCVIILQTALEGDYKLYHFVFMILSTSILLRKQTLRESNPHPWFWRPL